MASRLRGIEIEREPGSRRGCRRSAARAVERQFEQIDLLVIYIDGMVFGEHHVTDCPIIPAAGADTVSAVATLNTPGCDSSQNPCWQSCRAAHLARSLTGQPARRHLCHRGRRSSACC